MTTAAYIGIDLGTTYSAVATIDTVGRPKIIKNNGTNITPSCLMLENDELIIGAKPEAKYGQPGFEVGARFKSRMGEDHRTHLGKRDFTPTDFSAAILKEMKRVAEREVGPIAGAVITIPANFEQEARDATMLAARKAGLNVKHIINEPTAAALYYGYKEAGALDGHYVVYDLGGGTFDVSIIHVNGDNIEVVATEGVRKLGGDDFDKSLRDLIRQKYQDEFDIPLSDQQLPLSDMAELKKELTDQESKKIFKEDQLVEIHRHEFEAAINGLIQQTELLCETVLEEAGLDGKQIQAVFLAGGSTRMPAIRASIEKTFQQEPLATANVDEVVALGAALYAAMKAPKTDLNTSQASAIARLSVEEIATYYFGTISLGFSEARETERHENSIIIEKGEKIPVSKTIEFSTVADGQTAVNCRVTRSASPEIDPRFVTKIWSGRLELPPGRPKGQIVLITFSFDENGMMKCQFVDQSSGRETIIELANQNKPIIETNIDKFLVD